MENAKPWLTDQPTVFQIGGRKINVAKKGREQATQIYELNKWLRENIAPLAEKLRGIEAGDTSVGLSLIGAMDLTPDSQMQLAQIIIGNKDADGQPYSPGFLDEFYDMNWVMDGVAIAGQSASIQRMLTGFFTSVG